MILAHNFRIRIMPDNGFAVKYKKQYDFHFLEKITLFKKKKKKPFLANFVHLSKHHSAKFQKKITVDSKQQWFPTDLSMHGCTAGKTGFAEFIVPAQLKCGVE